MSADLAAQYNALVASGALRPDPAQLAVLPHLQTLKDWLEANATRKIGLFAGLFAKPLAAPKGIYLYGGVGRGKSMLMDLFCDQLAIAQKRRTHFHAFMQDIHHALHEARKTGVDDPIAPVAEALAQDLRFLALDEMQISDITDAMIVGRLFDRLLSAGVVIITTCNRPPQDLYLNGLNRALFLPFIALLHDRLEVLHLQSPTDYRQHRLQGAQRYFHPAGKAQAAIAAIWRDLTGGATPQPLTLSVNGRAIELPQFVNGIGRASFWELCAKPLGPADFLAIAAAVKVLILEDIPQLSASNYNEAKRFVILIDALYEARVRLIASAADEPERLYIEGAGSFEFERTASRLREMQAANWGAQPGGSATDQPRFRPISVSSPPDPSRRSLPTPSPLLPVPESPPRPMPPLTCFKAYDIRGRLGIDLDAAIAARIGRAFACALSARRVVVGRDCRASSAALSDALITALISEGVEVLDLGLAGTEEMYWATSAFAADGGIEVTASHNPMDYNGLKLVRAGSAPLDAQTGLAAIKSLAEANDFGPPKPGGSRRDVAAPARAAYVGAVMGFVDPAALRPLRIVVNCGNGAAGPTFDAIASALAAAGAPLTFHRIHHDPDGSFPNGIPNPLLPENRPVTAAAVRARSADLGIAFDGDFDRCFFFDAKGDFVDGEYIVGLLAQVFLAREPGARIVHDPRVIWNTIDVVTRAGGTAIQTKTGHTFLKQALRDHDAVYGGELSAHHYFRDFVACDSGMIPWLLLVELMGRTGQSLAQLVAARRAAFPSSGEMNFNLPNPTAALARVRAAYAPLATGVDETDGLGLSFATWRFNLRASNTEPVVRLNVESRGDAGLVGAKVAEIRKVLLE